MIKGSFYLNFLFSRMQIERSLVKAWQWTPSHMQPLYPNNRYRVTTELWIGGYTLRITGAQRQATKEIHVLTIKALARHSWVIIASYIALAPVQALTEEYKRRMATRTLSNEIRSDKMLNVSSTLGSSPPAFSDMVQRDIQALTEMVTMMEIRTLQSSRMLTTRNAIECGYALDINRQIGKPSAGGNLD